VLEIRALTEADVEAFWEVRLRALRESPEAFGMSYENARDTPLADVAKRLRNDDRSPDGFVLGAFEGALVGIAGLRRDQGEKVQHKAMVWGVFVVPEARDRGTGRLLMSELVDRAIQLPGLEQLYLSVVTTNPAARGLYLSLGFEVYGVEPRALKVNGRYLDEELMVLKLDRESSSSS
jgi:ribosomal protein S18 acetylase RimI-like enzyme